ncbi:unnamed protein product [Amoebophrya sp. A120]|nr:unnamed protein product [Amoebophrya sp. A120]|eukprot:GSA120T00001154001.1
MWLWFSRTWTACIGSCASLIFLPFLDTSQQTISISFASCQKISIHSAYYYDTMAEEQKQTKPEAAKVQPEAEATTTEQEQKKSPELVEPKPKQQWVITLTNLLESAPNAEAPALAEQLNKLGFTEVTTKSVKNKIKSDALRKVAEATAASRLDKFEQMLQKYAKADVARAFGSRQRFPQTGQWTWPEDAFLGNPVKDPFHPASPFKHQLPKNFLEVLSPDMYKYKQMTGEHAHCKHTSHLMQYLLRVAGGAPNGIRHAISAPYFDPKKKQVFYSFADQLGSKPITMPAQVRQSFEQRGWKVFKDFVADVGGFFEVGGRVTEQEEQKTTTTPSAAAFTPTIDTLILDLDTFGYAFGNNTGHGMLIFKLKVNQEKTLFRVVHSFAHKFSLDQWMQTSAWLTVAEAQKYWEEGIKPFVFSRADEKEKAKAAFSVLFQEFVEPEFDTVSWDQRKGFSNGQSLSVSRVDAVGYEKFVEDVLPRFYDAFAGLQ